MQSTFSRSPYSKGSAFRGRHHSTQDSSASSLLLGLCTSGRFVQAFIQHKLLLLGSVLLLLEPPALLAPSPET